MIYVKTASGQQVVKDRSVALSPRQRSALILVDGKKTLEQILQATQSAGVSREDLKQLAALGLIVDASPEQSARENAAAQAAAAAVERHKKRSPQERYAEAYPIAVKLTGELGLRGFRLNLAVEAAANYDQLCELAPKIREAVGPAKYAPLGDALSD
jgi:hypothetical protein